MLTRKYKLITVLILIGGNLCFGQDTIPYLLKENLFSIDQTAYDFSHLSDLVLIEYSNKETRKDTLLTAKFDNNGNEIAEIRPPGKNSLAPGRTFYKVINNKIAETTHFDYEMNDKSSFGKGIYTYDSIGRLIKFESFGGQKNQKWIYEYKEENTYDSLNHLILNVRYDAQWRRRKEFYEYDKQGRELFVKGFQGFDDKPSYIVAHTYFNNGYQYIQDYLSEDSLKEIHKVI